MDALEDADENTPDDGIYSTCPVCFAIIAFKQGHQAWHSRGEGVTNAD